MGLSGASLNRFRRRVDATLEDLFPAVLVIGGVEVSGSGPGGRTMTEYMDGGEATNFRHRFRLAKSVLPDWQPVVGAAVDWKISETETLAMEIREVVTAPHEDRWGFVCGKRRRA